MKYNKEIENIISLCYSEQKDVFMQIPIPEILFSAFDKVKTLVLFPNAFSFAESPFCNVNEPPELSAYEVLPDVLYADVRFMAQDCFREFLYKNNCARIVVLFPECAKIYEYGYKLAFSWIGEYKAQTNFFVQTVLFVSTDDEFDFSFYETSFLCKDSVFIGKETEISFSGICFDNTKQKYSYLLRELQKFAYKSSCVYFSSRGEAADFAKYLLNENVSFCYYDGNLSNRKRKEVLSEYKYEKFILIATKSFIPESVFIKSDNVFYCGVPFSVSHLKKCSLASKNAIECVYCYEDFLRNARISKSFSQKLMDDKIFEKRQKLLLKVKDSLK